MSLPIEETADYTQLETIHEGRLTAIYRAIRAKDKIPVILKFSKPGGFYLASEYRLRNEFAALSRSASALIIKALGFETFHNRPLLVLEDFRGINLAAVINNGVIDLIIGLQIAIKIAQAIGEMHQCNIIHKDIKPQNILINQALTEIKLIDFGIASLLSREIQQTVSPEFLEGTIAYISPEQTGRMNRAIDYRSDIYSFGVTLYQMFTQKLPFEAPTSRELIYQHIAVIPIHPHTVKATIPEALSAIIMKCLAKNAEERYHSAFGLKKDLEICLAEYSKNGFVEYFQPGKFDVFDHFQIAQKLYGREFEIHELQKSLYDSKDGPFQIAMLQGSPGAGKSSIVNELQKLTMESNGYFISGKYEQFKKNIQYLGLIQAFQHLLQQLLGETEEKLAVWKHKILDAVGINGQLIIDLIPDVQLIIGSQPPVPDIMLIQEENRLNYTLSKFIEVFLDKDHPLVIFLDDLQWIDEASAKFLKFFTSDLSHGYFFLIGAYRDQEVDADHVLQGLIGQIQSYCPVKILNIKPLKQNSLSELIQDSFHTSQQDAQNLAEHVFAKTKGNPFFTIQFLKTLYVKGILNFDAASQGWKTDFNKIAQMPFADNVVQVMTEKLKDLKKNTQAILQIGAAIGSHFSLKCLAEVYGQTASQTLIDLEEACQEEFILMQRMPQADEIEFVFQHDRIQEAAYELIQKKERPGLNYRIGQVLLKQAGNKASDQIIEIVTHLNEGLSLIKDKEEKETLISLNLEAGRRSRQVAAYGIGQKYLEIVLKLMGPKGWEENYQRSISLYEDSVVCSFMQGDSIKAQHLLQQAIQNTKTPEEKMRFFVLKSVMLVSFGKFKEALDSCAEALLLYGIHLPFKLAKGRLLVYALWILSRLFIRGLDYVYPGPKTLGPKSYGVGGLYITIYSAAFLIGNEGLCLYIILKLNELTLKYGNVESSANALATFGGILASSRLQLFKWGMQLGLAAEKMSVCFPKTNGYALWMFSHLSFHHRWQTSHRARLEFIQKAAKKNIELGTINLMSYCQVHYIATLFNAGENLDVVTEELEQLILKEASYNLIDSCMRFLIWHEFLLQLKGSSKDVLSLEFKEKHLKEFEGIVNNLAHQYTRTVFEAVLAYLKETSPSELKACSEKLKAFEGKFPGAPTKDTVSFYTALIHAALYESNASSKSWKEFIYLHRYYKKLSKYAPSYVHQFLILEGEKARLEKKNLLAVDYFERAIQLAESYGYIQDQALACKLLAKSYLKIGKHIQAGMYMRFAYDRYLQWGASEIARIIRSLYPQLVESYEGTSLDSTTTQSSFDLEAIIEASQALSREIKLDRVIESLMQIVLVNAGASKAFLISPDQNKLIITAEMAEEQELVVQPNVPLANRSDDLCVSIIKYTERSKKNILLNDVLNEGPLIKDPYVVTKQPRSIMCLPLLHKEELKGILYLENNKMSAAFNPGRVKILTMLSSQMAISLENAQFYATMEKKVQERTRELSQKNSILEETLNKLHSLQDQLIQQEKLAAMGMLTQGIAHQIKNPLNFIGNFGQLSFELMKEMEGIIKKRDLEKDEELLELTQEAQSLLTKLEEHVKRADNIVNSMRAHVGTADKQASFENLPDLIDQVISVTYNNYRQKDTHFHVEIRKKYDPEVPQIKVFIQEINRVFYNIFDNAMFFLSEKFKKNPLMFAPNLEIQVVNGVHDVSIVVKDNGPGIAKENLKKIFEPFFTTKPGSLGTGLGLSIIYDIITKQHSGTIDVDSEEGQFTEFRIKLPKK